MIKRELEDKISQLAGSGKAIIVLGPRQTGKTTLLEHILAKADQFLFLNCDDLYVRTQLENANTQEIKQIIGNHKNVFIDEAQRVKNIGIQLKLITDNFKEVQLYVSGSSSFDLANEINEPLTGRKWEYRLFPVSWVELQKHIGYLASMQQLEQRIIYGMYPEIIMNQGNEIGLLKQLTGSYLYKDLLSYKGIKKPETLDKILRALALQVGNEVSYNELATLVKVDKNTVSSYIDLLEKAYVIFKLQPLSRNLRNEISSSRKIYFYDTGIRNCIINNFNSLDLRNDTGALWENFIIAERMKFIHYNDIYSNTYFWRTHARQEIDYIEEYGGKFSVFEIKWNDKKTPKFPKSFMDSYSPSTFRVVNKSNFLDFISTA